MRAEVLKYIELHKLIEPGQRLLVAFSGGPDSVALLHLLCTVREEWKLEIAAVHLNHMIRKNDSISDEEFCRRLCDRMQVEFISKTVDVPSLARDWKVSVEQAARKCRYQLFSELAREFKYDRVALGHHADDQAETVLFRLIRGSGRTGLVGMLPKRDIYVRPMLCVNKSEIQEYLEAHDLEYCVDESNRDIRYRRNFIRQKLIPLIEENLNPSVRDLLVETADTLSAEEAYLSSRAMIAVKNTVKLRPSGKFELDLIKLYKMDLWLRRRVVRHCLTQLLGGELFPDKQTVERLVNLDLENRTQFSLPGNIQAFHADNKLYLASSKKVAFNISLKVSGRTEVPELGLAITCKMRPCEYGQLVRQRNSRSILMDRLKIESPLFVRSIKSGDSFVPLGMSGSKKIGDYLIDRKVPRILRDEIAVVCDRQGIVWLVGFVIAERVKIDENTKEALSIEYSKKRQYPARSV